MLHREDDLVQAVMQVVPLSKNIKESGRLKKEPAKSVHWADPLVDKTLTEGEVWKMIMAVADVKPKSLREHWHQLREQYLKKGNLQIYKTMSVPIYLAEVDRMRNFRSLTAGASVKNRQGKWNNLDVIIDSGAAVTLLSEKTYDAMGSPGEIFEGVDVPLLDASGNGMKVRGLVKIPLKFGKLQITIPALVLPGLNPAMIIGMDYLEAAKGVIDLGRMELNIPELGIIKLSGSPTGMAANVNSVEIAPSDAGVVWLAAPSTAIEGDTIWVDNKVVRPGVYMARSVGRVREGRVAGSGSDLQYDHQGGNLSAEPTTILTFRDTTGTTDETSNHP